MALADEKINSQAEGNLQEQKNRISKIWSEWETIQKIPELVSLFDRKTSYTGEETPKNLLIENNYPDRSKISNLEFGDWEVNLDSKFIKDGYMYLLRGDYPNLEMDGFYSRPYGYGKKSTEQLTKELHSPEEVGYFLYFNEAYLTKATPSSNNMADELAFKQSQIGGSSFISTTTNLSCAISGTGNSPDREEQDKYEIYILKIPVENVINSNTGNFFGMNEDEYLVPDCIFPEEIIAKFQNNQRELVYEYLHQELGVSREDLGISSE